MTTPTHSGSIASEVETALRSYGKPLDPANLAEAKAHVMAALSGTFAMYGRLATVTDVHLQENGTIRWTIQLTGSAT